MYFTAYREATGIQMTTTHGPHSQLGLWFTPALATDDDAVRSCMKFRLLESVLMRLRRLERDARNETESKETERLCALLRLKAEQDSGRSNFTP